MGKNKRLDVFIEKHFGLGVRWDNFQYTLHLSFALPFITFTLGLGKRKF